MRTSSARVAAFAAAVVIALPISARAHEPNASTPAGKPERPKTDRLAVLPIVLEGKHGSATISAIFNDVVSAAEMRLGLRVISYEEMFAASEEGLGDRVRDCGSDERCIAARLRAFNARLGLVVVLDFGSKPPLISLRLLDTDGGRMIESSVGEIESQTSESIRARTRDLFDKAGYGRAGRLIVDVTPPNARVSIGEGIDADAGSPNVFTVSPGRYDVSAGLDGWSSERSDAVVIGGSDTQVKLVLIKEATLIESPWLWVGIGAAAIGGGIALFFLTHEKTRCACAIIDGRGCEPCYE